MKTLANDIRHGLRILAKSPGATAVAVLTLAVALGACTTVFSVVKGVLLEPLPYSDPDRVVAASLLMPPAEGLPERERPLAEETLRAWRGSGRTIATLAAYQPHPFVLADPGDPERVAGAKVSPELFPLLGVSPVRGRSFASGETVTSERVAVLSYRLWQRRFGGDAGLLGESIMLDREPYTVLAVMPPSFFFPDRKTELWTPLNLMPGTAGGGSRTTLHVSYFPAVARLEDGVGLEEARLEAQNIAARVNGGSAGANDSPRPTGDRVHLTPFRDTLVGEVDGALGILSAAVGLVLLIACVNLAGLLLARSVSRREELAIRSALGARRSRILRQILTESTILGLLGGAAGLGLAFLLHRLVAFAAADLPRSENVRLDAGVFLFGFALAALTGLLTGFLPALRASSADPVEPLHGGAGVAWSGGRAMGAFVIVQVALAVVLLVGACLLLWSFVGLLHVDLGYQPERVVTAELELEPGRYGGQGWSGAPLDALLERLEENPGVGAAGVASAPPLSNGFTMKFVTVEGLPPARRIAVLQMTSPGYLEAIGARLAEGRWLTGGDHARRAPVAVVNRAFVSQNLPDGRALGRRVRLGEADFEIVGVVEDLLPQGPESAPRPELFASYHFAPAATGFGTRKLTLVVRSTEEAPAVVPLVRSALRDLDSHLPLNRIRPLEERLSETWARPRFYTLLLSVFAGIAVLLACAGLYGLLVHSVTRRTREIGIRRSLGAQGRHILWMVLGRGLALVVAGLVLGAVASWTTTRLLAHLLVGVTHTDPLAFSAAALLLLAVGILAGVVPALRAQRIEPTEALRAE